MLLYVVSWKTDISWKLSVSIPDDVTTKFLASAHFHHTTQYPTPKDSNLQEITLIFLSINKESSIEYQFPIYHSMQKLRKVSVQHNINLSRLFITKSLCSGKYDEWKTPDNVQCSHHHCTSVTDTNHSATCK